MRSLPLCSREHGLSGKADVVEFHADSRVYPVEYKRGKPKSDRCDEVQLCAQALCLEEMLAVAIDCGALYYGQKRRRKEVRFDDELRGLTLEILAKTRALLQCGTTPKAAYARKCDSCSLFSICLPKSCAAGRQVGRYLANALKGEP